MWLEAILRREGFDTRVAATGRETLREAYAKAPALVVLEESTSEPDVWETLDRLREFSTAPVLVLVEDGAGEERAMLAGAADSVAGRIDDLRLIARVRTLLRRHSQT